MPRVPETFLTFYSDPGEDHGWALGRDLKLLAAGTGKMWGVNQDLWYAINNPDDPSVTLRSMDNARNGVTQEELLGPIGRIVSEDWRIYPKEAMSGQLNWDRCRTARAIGGMQFMSIIAGIPFVLQPAAIKAAAVAAGAEELFTRPLRENRHQNDATMHFTFFTNVELMGIPLPVHTENSDG
jgi:hypothetical protein